MTIYKKLSDAKVQFQECDIKKTGYNKFGKWAYFELADFLPDVTKCLHDNGLVDLIDINNGVAYLWLHDTDDSEQQPISIQMPTAAIDMKGSQPIQNLGAATTYMRRYLYMTLFNIVESDAYDDVEPSCVTPEHIAVLNEALSADGYSIEEFLADAGIETLSDLPASRFDGAVKHIKNKTKKTEVKK